MTDPVLLKPSSTTLAGTMGAIFLANPAHFPPTEESYEILQPRGTYSDIAQSFPLYFVRQEYFAHQLSKLYHDLASDQARLEPEFEAAIFDDLEGLYET